MRSFLIKNAARRGLAPRFAQLLIGIGVVLLVPFSCTQVSAPQAEVPAGAPAPVTHAASITAPVQVKASGLESAPANYAEAIRQRDFARAAIMMDNATAAEQSSPEVRYARALVALQVNDYETALRKVDQLELDFPLFAAEAQAVRLKAARQSLDTTLIASVIRPETPEQKLVMARGYEREGNHLAAQKLADEALKAVASSKSKSDAELNAQAHAIKARCLQAEGKNSEAARELLWIAVHAPELDPKTLGLADDLDKQINHLDAKLKLSYDERIRRLRIFSDKGWVDKTQTELERLKADGRTPPDEHGLLAWALYVSRTDYEQAADLFNKAASESPDKKVEYLYYEAKALARSHRDRDAIAKYDRVARLGGKYAEYANYQAAHLRMMDGQFQSAAQGFERYLKSYGKRAQYRNEAQYSLAISHLANQEYQKSIPELRALALAEANGQRKAELMQLQAVGLLGAGRLSEASALFQQVISDRPLSFAALLAAARLAEMAHSVPPLIPPAPAPPVEQESLVLTLPKKAMLLSRVGLDAEAEAALRMNESMIRDQYGARQGEALCEMYGQMQNAQRRYQIAQTAASSTTLSLSPTSSTMWQWNCIYPRPYEETVRAESTRRSVPIPLVYGVMRQESAFRPEVVSPAAAVGLMQIIPKTARHIADELGVVYDDTLMNSPSTNIRFGTYYLRRLLDMFDNRYELAAAAYNAGPQALTRWLRAGETLPLDIFVARIPYTETRNYVYQVMGNYARYAYLSPDIELTLPDLNLPRGLKAPADAY